MLCDARLLFYNVVLFELRIASSSTSTPCPWRRIIDLDTLPLRRIIDPRHLALAHHRPRHPALGAASSTRDTLPWHIIDLDTLPGAPFFT